MHFETLTPRRVVSWQTMSSSRLSPFTASLLILVVGGCSALVSPSEVEERDPLRRPFSRSSIWNLPLGENASGPSAALSVTIGTFDAILVLEPEAPLTEVKQNIGLWDDPRCANIGETLFDAPIPVDYLLADRGGDNSPPDPWAILAADSRTLHEGHRFGRCTVGGPATATSVAPEGDIRGDALAGGHSPSGMSVLGGTLRWNELLPGAGRVRHPLKLAVPEGALSHRLPGYRWPALKPAIDFHSFGGKVDALIEGALLALPATFDLANASLKTEPARQLAWTLQHYGAYVVRAHPATGKVRIFVEHGPAGRFDEAFEAAWGYSIEATDTDFAADMKQLMSALVVIDDWNEARYEAVVASDGEEGVGGGAPRTSWATPLAEP